jgi:two-component system sensor histidine kinase AlgZ
MPSLPAKSRLPSFWTLQLGGWFVYGLAIAAASFPFRQMREYVGFQNCLLATEFAGSFGIWLLCRTLWRRHVPLLGALSISVVASTALGVICSALAMWEAVHWTGTSPRFLWSTALSAAGGGSFVLIAWSAFYFGLKHYAALEQSEALVREAQLQALRYQIQPHFLFNALNAISTLVLEGEKQSATKMIAKLGDLLRRSLDAPQVHLTTLGDEFAATQEYIDIERIRFGARLRVTLTHEPGMDRAEVPRFLLQPLVENAIRHGVAKRRDGGWIAVEARRVDNLLQLTVDNQGAPNGTRSGDPAGEGLGLGNTRTRLERIYASRGVLQAGPMGEDGYRVLIRLPYARWEAQ